jgi:nitroreductase
MKKRVGKVKLHKILEAARLSPSACNFQPWRFIVVTNPLIKERLRAAYDREWFASAPVIIVACAVLDEAWNRRDGEEYWKVDITIAMQNLILEAWEENLGTCWIGAFDEEKVKKILGIPENIRVVAMTPVGYPAEQKGKVTDRKSLDEIVFYEHW